MTESVSNRAESAMNSIRKALEESEISTDPTERIVDGLEKIQEKIELVQLRRNELYKKLENTEDDQSAQKVLEKINQTERELISLGDAADRYNQKINSIGENTRQAVDSQLEDVLNRLQNFEIPTTPTEQLQAEIENTRTKIALLQRQWQELSAADPSDKVVLQMLRVQQQIISTANSLHKLEEKLGEINAEKPVGTISKMLNGLRKKVNETAKAIVSKLGDSFSRVKNKASKIISSLGTGFSKLTAPVKKFGKTLSGAFKGVFVTAALYAGFRAIKDGFAEAAKADKKFASSLNEVKANLAIAFMPVIQTVMPALNTMMSGLAAAAKSVAGFISGLFGTTYKQSAEAVKKLKSTSDAAKKAKLSMAGIDEMNVLSGSDNDNDTKENNGIDFSKLDMTEPELPDWAERLKDSIRSGDWTGVGAILAERVNSALSSINWDKIQLKVNSGIGKIADTINGFLDNVSWETLGDALAGGLNTVTGAINTFYSKVKWDKLGSGIAKGLNQAIKKTNWKQLGKAFSGHIQAFIDTAYSFVTTFDWSGFGNAFGTAINAWFDGIDFGKAGKTLSEGIKGLLDFAINAVQTVDWQTIGEKIADFFSNIDYAGIASKVFDLLGSALGAGASLLWGAIQNAVFSIRDYFSEKIEECGGNIIEGLFKGIGDALKNVGKWIYNNVFTPFINGFKNAFDIHSPSKVMEKMGGFIIDGLYKAIAAGIAVIKKIFEKMRENIEEVFSKIHEWFEDKFSEAYKLIQDVFSGIGKWFGERWNDVKSVFSVVGDWFGKQFETAWGNIQNAFSDVRSWFQDRWDDIKNIFSDVGDWFEEKFRVAYDNVTRIWDGVTGYFSGLWEDISNGARDGVNWIIDKINGLLGAVEDGLNFIVDAINSKFTLDIPDEVPVIGGTHFGMNMPSVDIPEIPHLAKGGLATEPTLAMVGDNRNARTDPEVIAPLSKLRDMTGGDLSEIIELLKLIVELLRDGMNIEVINYLFRGSNEFNREVLKVVRNDRIRKGEL